MYICIYICIYVYIYICIYVYIYICIYIYKNIYIYIYIFHVRVHRIVYKIDEKTFFPKHRLISIFTNLLRTDFEFLESCKNINMKYM